MNSTAQNIVLDYCPFGSAMPGKSFTGTDKYRFGFNGQEKENDISGVDGGHMVFTSRIEDTRLGRFLSVDPLSKEYPWNSTYAFAENDVIRSIDLEGAEKLVANTVKAQNLLSNYLEVLNQDDILKKVGITPFTSGADEKYLIFIVAGKDSWHQYDGETISYTNPNNVTTFAERLIDIESKDKKDWSGKDYNEIGRMRARFEDLGISPQEVLNLKEQGFKMSVISSDIDVKTLAHELIIHETDALDGNNDSSGGEEHEENFGSKFYKNKSRQFSPADNKLTKDMKWYDTNKRLDNAIKKVKSRPSEPAKSGPLK